MQKVNNVLDLVGRTPLVRINKLADPNGAEIWAKIEFFNPGSSIKDRIAIRIIGDYEKQGLLKPGGTIIEATSGNTGMGLALVCAVKGYKCIFVMPDKISEEKRNVLRAMGAEVVICPTAVDADDPASFYSVSQRLVEETEGAILSNQYFNPSNVAAHYETTGPEIWEQTGGKIDALVASMGTGGTITGAGKYLKEKNPDIKIWAADPFGSIFKEYKDTGKITPGHPYLVEGIGEDMIPGILDIDLVDEIVNVTDEDSFYVSRQMARKEGILGGGSTGTNMKLALDVAAAMRPDQVVVTIIPDTGDRYLSKHYSDQWLNEKGLLSRDRVSLYRLNRLKDTSLISIISANPGESVRSALERMTNSNVSQLPVLDGDGNLGSLRESALLTLALKDQAVLEQPVRAVMEQPFPTLDETATVNQSKQLLLENQGIVTTRNAKIVGFITRHDIINFSDK